MPHGESSTEAVIVPVASLNQVQRHTFIETSPEGEPRVVEIDALVCTEAQWEARPESSSPLWSSVLMSNGLIRAIRFPVGLR